MATGPEHYQEAEGLLSSIVNRDVLAAEIEATMAVAQVHATLALAAATALSTAPGHEPYDYGEWRDATGTH